MSFLYTDKALLEQLLKIAQDTSPDMSPEQKILQDNLNKLINNLRTNLSSAKQGITHGQSSDVQLKPENIANLQSLLSFLATNKFMSDGKIIVSPTNPKDEAYSPYLNFFINDHLLSAYITSLQAQLQSQHNPIFAQKLIQLIREANIDLELQPPIKETLQAPKVPGKPGEQSTGDQMQPIDLVQHYTGMAQLKPFYTGQINFDAIKTFAKSLLEVVSADSKDLDDTQRAINQNIIGQIGQVHASLSEALDITRRPNLSLSTSISDLTNQIAPDNSRAHTPWGLLHALTNLMSSCKNLYLSFEGKARGHISSNAFIMIEQQSQVIDQNISTINQLQARLQEALLGARH